MVSFDAFQDYAPDATLAEARSLYFARNGFGPNGGYDEAWVDFMLGPVPMPFPNTPARVRAVRYHDLHHVLTGYRTDFWGEMDISAWEIGAGCKDYAAAWQLNLGGLAGGALFKPGRTFRAFVRGRRAQSLYGKDFEPLLGRTVGDVRRELGLAETDSKPRLVDRLLFAFWAVVGFAVGLVTLALIVPLLPLAYFGLNRLKSRSTRMPLANDARSTAPRSAT
jgi:hypothetical protein